MQRLASFAIGFVAGAAAMAALVWYLAPTSPQPKPQIAVNQPAETPLQLPPSAPPAHSGDTTAPNPPDATSAVPLGRLMVPVAGVAAAALRDTYFEKRGSDRIHEALDILAPRGTPVIAAADGTIKKLFTSKPGGLTIYEFDPSESYALYYAHLDSYAPDIADGGRIKQGQLLGYVGSTGNADPSTPHLHFAIFKLNPDKRWWEGTPINPYPLLTH